MAGTRKRPVELDESTVMCDNHPNVAAVHTTSSELHQAISLCEACLRRIGSHMRDR